MSDASNNESQKLAVNHGDQAETIGFDQCLDDGVDIWLEVDAEFHDRMMARWCRKLIEYFSGLQVEPTGELSKLSSQLIQSFPVCLDPMNPSRRIPIQPFPTLSVALQVTL